MSQNGVTPYINVARIVKTHGKRGEVVVEPIDGLPSCLSKGMRVCLTPPRLDMQRTRTIRSVQGEPSSLVSFEGVDDLGTAEKIVGSLVLARRQDVPQAVHEREVLGCVGRLVHDERYGVLGVIEEVLRLPANDVWRVVGEAYGEVLVPVVDEVVLDMPEDSALPVVVHVLDGTLDLA